MNKDELMGMTHEPDLADPVQVYVDRVIKALSSEFKADDQVPRFVIICECPPESRVGVASTCDDEIDTHRVATLGAAAVRNDMDDATKTRARQMWQLMKAGFERRN